MKKVNVFEVKAKFAEYLDRAGRGEPIVIYRYNEPVAELRGLASPRTDPRPIGPLAGRPTFDLPPSFFEPLSDDELGAWEGGLPGDPATSAFPPVSTDTSARVAERPPPPATKVPRTKRRRS